MKYVIDSSVAFKWVVAEIDSNKANSLRDDYRNGVHELLAPDIFPAEIANALLVAERRNRVAAGQFAPLLADVLTTCPVLHPTRPLLARVCVLAAAVPISIYDGLYVALAEREACELITADDKLVKKLQAQHPFVVSVASLP